MKKAISGIAILLGMLSQAHAQVSVSDAVEFKLKNVKSGLVLSVPNASQTAGTSLIQWTDNSTADQRWHFIPMGSGRYNIENLATHQVLGISGGSRTNGALAVQWADNSTADHLWTLTQAADGSYMIKNVNSGLYLEVYQGSTANGASVDQWGATGCTCQNWQLVSTGNSPYPAPGAVSGTGTDVHDPFLMRDPAGKYWLYGTNNTLASSTDRINFTNVGKALTPIPAWTTTYTHGSMLWAPDVFYMNNQYYQYYSASSDGSQTSAIGLATAPTPDSTSWTDQGIVISSSPSTPYNAIDPSIRRDQSGNLWMSFGSWWHGIYLMQLDPATGKQLANTSLIHLAERANGLEGSILYYYNGYYYLFASINGCCSGVNSTYRTIVGRSTSITGPYIDRGGVNMLNGGGTIVVSAHGNIQGPGGETLLTDTDGPVMGYHYYDGNNNGAHTLGINRIGFSADGWPYIY